MTREQRTKDLCFIAAVSACVLAYELLLTRILAVHYWSYFASMIVSLAMLGFAASGTVLFLLWRSGKALEWWVTCGTVGLILSLPVCPLVSERIECIPSVVLWDLNQVGLFALNYLVLLIPFLLGGFIVGSFFLSSPLAAGRIYCANMLGAGIGILVSVVWLCELPPAIALAWVAFPVAVFACFRDPGRMACLLLGAALAVSVGAARCAPERPRFSQYKGMHRLLLMPDASVEYSTWNRFGYLAVVDSKTIRHAPGLSLAFGGTLPDQKAVFTNGDDMEPVCRGGDDVSLSGFFGSMVSALPFTLREAPRVLVSGAGGGMDVLAALANGAAHVNAVENNTAMARLMQTRLAPFSGNLYGDRRVQLSIGSARLHAVQDAGCYDIVVLPARRSLFAATAGTAASDPDFLLTREALGDFLSALGPRGILAMETWINLPPRHEARLFATAVDMLRRKGLDPGAHLAAVRSLRTCLVLVFRDPVGASDRAGIRRFCEAGLFDPVYYPGMAVGEANRFNVVERAPYATLFRDLIGDMAGACRRHPFLIRPATDDRPYFGHFFKWAALPQLLDKAGPNVAAHVGWGYTFLLITLAQAVPLGAILILAPLASAGRSTVPGYRYRYRAYGYFAFLGPGFMFLELAAIQQFARFLPHPVYAFGLTIGIVLVGAGVGARLSAHRAVRHSRLFAGIVLLLLTYLGMWQVAIRLRSHTAFLTGVVCLALLSVGMGMPFPRGIERLRRCAPQLVPWAWGINGYASVLAVLAAGLVLPSIGLSGLVSLAAAGYLGAALTFPPEPS